MTNHAPTASGKSAPPVHDGPLYKTLRELKEDRAALLEALKAYIKGADAGRVSMEVDRKARAAILQAESRACTCHPDDSPPRPCPQRFALSDCRAAISLAESREP